MANGVMGNVIGDSHALDISKNDTPLKGVPNTVSSNGPTNVRKVSTDRLIQV